MTNQYDRSIDPADLRQKAEALAREQITRTSEDSAALSPEDIRKKLHELRVHQIELELQNEELRHIQAVLEESRARYFGLYDLAPVGYLTLSEKGLILETNLTASTLLGTTRGMLVKQPISRFILKENQDIYYLHRKKLFETGEPQECELRLVKPNGTLFWAHLTATTAQAKDGSPVCRCVLNDISGRKRAEEARKELEKTKRETEQKFKTLVEKCPASVMLFDEQERVDFVNDWHIERFANNKLGKEYFIGKSIHELPGLVNAGVDKEVARIFQGENIEIEDVYFPEFAVGGSGWVNIRAVPIYKDGRIAGGILLRENITARKKIEIALHKSQQKYMSLVESVQDVIYIHTPEGHFTYLSPQISDLLGYEVQELTGKNFQDLIHPQDLPVMQRGLEEALDTGKRHDEIEHRVMHKNGQWRWIHVRASSQRNSEGEIESILGVARDITDRKRAEEKIRLINQKLERANSEKDKLFTIIAHDLKSPMGGVFSTSQILAQEAESLPLDQIRFISTEMHKSMENALELLNDLMQWARMSQGGMDFSPEKCCLGDLVNSSLHVAQDMAGKKEITIEPDIPEGLAVLVDQPMINAVIRNIIFNAVKFTNRGGHISITASNTGSGVEVCVQDDGIGMSDVILSSIFTVEKIKRPLGTDGEKGTGLGLILCKEFVEKHGGEIRVESKPDKGTKVFFTLPGSS